MKPTPPRPRMIKHGCGLLVAIISLSVVISRALALSAYAGDNKRQRCDDRAETRNYIIRRQQSYSVQGTPTMRIYTHGRKIDIYRDGTSFERDHVAGRSR